MPDEDALIYARDMRVGLIVLVLGIAGAGMAIAKSGGHERADCQSFRFDSRAWKADARHPARRTHQAKMLIACRTLQGMRRAKVRRLLGAADDWDRHGVSYELGPDALGIDSEFLAVDFRARRVVRVFEYQG